MSGYFKDLSEGIVSTLKGMSVTLKHFFSKPVTVQYPDERLPISDRYRGKHKMVQGGCRGCGLCAKVCPVDCIEIEFERHMKRVLEWKTFTIDYNKCVFCGLCTEACPAESLVMTQEFDLSTEDRREVIKDLLEWRGLREEDLENIRLLEEKEKEKVAAAKEEAAEGGKKKEAEEAAAGGGKENGEKE
jgi:NADH-quinone oxidoreductase subunit I